MGDDFTFAMMNKQPKTAKQEYLGLLRLF